ncbi:MAG: acyl carrier protein [Micromonosporaceae bacterium]|nr:acyl carrier protein [Micromonosporaceae bacterium]
MTESPTISVEDIRDVLIRSISAELGIPPSELATDRPFAEHGVDSLAALSVAMELEDACGLTDLPATLLWDYPTVDVLAPALRHLADGRPMPAGEGE